MRGVYAKNQTRTTPKTGSTRANIVEYGCGKACGLARGITHRPTWYHTRMTRGITHKLSWLYPHQYRGITLGITWYHTQTIVVSHTRNAATP